MNNKHKFVYNSNTKIFFKGKRGIMKFNSRLNNELSKKDLTQNVEINQSNHPTALHSGRKYSTNIKSLLAELADKISKFINSLIEKTANQATKAPIIHHLGGTYVASHDPEGKQAKLDRSHYFFEGVPVKINKEVIFIYGGVLKPHVEEWMSKVEAGETQATFQDFLAEKMEKDDNLQSSLLGQQVRYFNDEDRKKTEIKVENGQLMQIGLDNPDPELKTLTFGSYAFVIADVKNEKGEIERHFYATPKVKTGSGKIQHSSFTRGSNVVSAGMLEVNDKQQIVGIRNQSGHYKPTSKEIAHLIKHLTEAGFDTSQLHVTCAKSQLRIVLNRFGISWGIVNHRADKWFSETGHKLLKS
jgi:hypothetical protein